MKKEIKIGLLSHYLKHENLGCVALSLSNIKIIKEVCNDINVDPIFYFLVDKNFKKIDLDFLGSQCYYREIYRLTESIKHPVKYLKSEWFNDLDLIFNLNGGDGFTDIYGFKRLIAESVQFILASNHKKNIVMAPQTIGPFKTKKGKIFSKYILKKCNFIFSRDMASTEYCKLLGLNNICQVIDVAFTLDYSKPVNIKEKSIGLNVSGLLFNGGYNKTNYFGLKCNYKVFTEKLIANLLNKGYSVHLIGHVNSFENEIEDDYRICEYLHNEFPQTILAPRFENPIDAKNYISQMEIFTGARMHSTIGAFSSDTAVIPIAYSRKFNGLYKDTLKYNYVIDLNEKFSEDEQVENFNYFLDHLNEMKKDLIVSKGIYKALINEYKITLKDILSNI